MSNNYLDIIRPGINTTFQDKGRDHLYHIGIPFSGAMDNRNYLIANKLVNNKLDSAVIEFAYQGPHLKYSGEKINFVVTGDVIFSIKKKDNEIEGNCYQSYQIENGDEINIISTNKSVYGYLALGGELDLKFQWNSCSINTKANIGSNDGKTLDVGQRINLKKINSFLYGFLFLFFLSPILYSYVSLSQTDKRTDYPGKDIAMKIQYVWDQDFDKEIQFVTGDEWKAGNLSYHLK